MDEIGRMIEELRLLFMDIKDLVSALNEEEKRSHAERERILRDWLDEARRIRALLERQNEIFEELCEVIREAKLKLQKLGGIL